MKKLIYVLFSMPIIALILLDSCTLYPRIEREVVAVHRAKELNKWAKYLKVHMKDGELYVLHDWTIRDDHGFLQGTGNRYDINRKLVGSPAQTFRISIPEAALFETNKLQNGDGGQIAGMTLVTVPMGLLTISCITCPKCCFGSCPTYYASDGDTTILQAEGFSSSIAPVYERTDIDMLYHAGYSGSRL